MDNKISLKKCRKVLKETGKSLSDEQIIAVRDYLYELAQIDIDIFRSIEKREKEQKPNGTDFERAYRGYPKTCRII